MQHGARTSGASARAAGATAAPQFGRLIQAGLRSVGVGYVSLDHLRKAKKNALNEREYVEMWKLLHDLVLVALLDFELDVDEMRRENAPDRLEAAITDQHAHALWKELVRASLFDWGFVATAFYVDEPPPSGAVLLLALAWLLAYTRFFERQHEQILHIYLNGASVRLPPYPNDVTVPTQAIAMALQEVVTETSELSNRVAAVPDEARVRQMQALHGRLVKRVKALHAHVHYHSKLLRKLEAQQREAGADDDQLLPAYALQLFAQGKAQMELHMRALAERLQIIEDEKLFYKWINSLLVVRAPASDSTTTSRVMATALRSPEEAMLVLTTHYSALCAVVQAAQGVVRSSEALYREIAASYQSEWKKWQQKTKTRTQTVKMEEKMAALARDIAVNELPDASTIFLEGRKPRQPAASAAAKGIRPGTAVTVTSSPNPDELARLREQLERVLGEISTEYCGAQLK